MALFPRYSGPPLMDHICGVDNLTLAWRRVRSNIQVARRGQSAGLDQMTLRDFEVDWTRQMNQLADELRTGAYRPVAPKRVSIPKASGGARAIAILTVRDRIAQRAVHQALEPLFDPFFLDCSYGCRPRVGVSDAVARVARYAEQGLTSVVDADVASYFDHIDHRILLSLVRQRIDEAPLLQLLAQWLNVGTLGDDHGETGHDARWSAEAAFDRAREMLARLTDVRDDPFERMPVRFDVAGDDLPGGWGTATPIPADPLDHGRRGGIEQKVWTAMLIARPVLRGARRALPVAQWLGQHPVALAGAVAAGAIAAGGVTLQRQQTRPRGAPQGGALSPLLANIYLHPFDLALTGQGFRLVRFMDDFVIMCADDTEAAQALAFARRQIATLRLQLNEEKTSVARYADGVEFLGQALLPRRVGSRFERGLTTFADAEQALRAAARKLRRT